MKTKREYVEEMGSIEEKLQGQINDLKKTGLSSILEAYTKGKELIEDALKNVEVPEIQYTDFKSLDLENMVVGDLAVVNEKIIDEENTAFYVNTTKELIKTFLLSELIDDTACRLYPEEDEAKLIVLTNLLTKEYPIEEIDEKLKEYVGKVA